MQNDVKQVDRYLKMKRGLYYRPDNKGYTGLKSEAGRYPYDPASLGGGVIILHEDNADEFSPACWPETKLAAKDAEIAALQATVARLRENISHCQGRFLNINIALSSGGTKAEAIRIADVGEDCCKGYLTYETPKEPTQ